MKRQEKKEFWQKDLRQLRKLVAKKRRELARAILNLGEEKDKNRPKKLKREIAILLTIIKEKEVSDA